MKSVLLLIGGICAFVVVSLVFLQPIVSNIHDDSSKVSFEKSHLGLSREKIDDEFHSLYNKEYGFDLVYPAQTEESKILNFVPEQVYINYDHYYEDISYNVFGFSDKTLLELVNDHEMELSYAEREHIGVLDMTPKLVNIGDTQAVVVGGYYRTLIGSGLGYKAAWYFKNSHNILMRLVLSSEDRGELFEEIPKKMIFKDEAISLPEKVKLSVNFRPEVSCGINISCLVSEKLEGASVVVYEADTSEWRIVSREEEPNGQILSEVLTDSEGYAEFMLSPGNYIISVDGSHRYVILHTTQKHEVISS
jgi:hypothetical protein